MNKLGVNIVGYPTNQAMGLSQNSEQIYNSLVNTDIDIKKFYYTLDKETQIDGNDNNVNIICMNPDILKNLSQLEYRGFKCKDKINIGLWAWETDLLPKEWIETGKQFDEIWTVSNYSKNIIQKYFPEKPIYSINIIGRKFNILNKSEYKKKYKLSDDLFICLYIFDFNSDFYRKNPIGAIKAFKKAFKENENVFFIIKISNGELHPQQLFELYKEANSTDKIWIINHELSIEELTEIYNISDLYISLHRSEGSGLTIMEMIMMEKPVVCTNYSGNLDFCKENYTNLVDYKLVPINKESMYYTMLEGRESKWAEPNIDDAAIKIKSVYNNYQKELEKMSIGKQYIEDNYNSFQLYNFIKNRINNIIKK
jgi:glycosyltransferase involved in cell wall biosynthesis